LCRTCRWRRPQAGALDSCRSGVGANQALTAWQGLFERARLQPGETVLVHGGAGAVGGWAVQLARWRGARVIATASAANAGFVAELGADQVIDYRATAFEDLARDVDVAFDTVGGETLRRSLRILKPSGRIQTIVSPPVGLDDPRVKDAFFIVEPNRTQLFEVAALLDQGRVRAMVDAVVSLSEAPLALSGSVPRTRRGKVVVTMSAEATRKGQS
jgi:NADPH:quinone reductase-like Zn-dependent oxidoreductase